MNDLELPEDDGSLGFLQEESIRNVGGEILKGVDGLLAQNGGDKPDVKIGINIQKDKPKVILGQLFIGFSENLLNLDLKPTEFKIFIYILKMMNYGNLVSLKQSTICKDLSLDKSAVNRAWKELIKKKVLIDKDGHIFFNSNYCAKGIASSLTKERIDNLKSSNVSDDNIKQMLNLDVVKEKKGTV